MFCLSKGLAAPVGSMLVGAAEFIARARRFRKMLGGGMRQAGVLAAAGILSLETMTLRVVEDHCRAKMFADGLRGVQGIVLDEDAPQTNMIYFNLAPHVTLSAEEISQRMAECGILLSWIDARRSRLVTHYEIDDVAVARAVEAFKGILG